MMANASPRSDFLCSRSSFWSALVLASLAFPVSAAGGLAATVHFDIGPQRLPTAMLRYSEQSGVQVTSPAELLAGRHSPGVQGSINVQRALTQLLVGTGLEFDVVDETTVAIRPIQAGSAAIGSVAPGSRRERGTAQVLSDVHLAQASVPPNTTQSLPPSGNAAVPAAEEPAILQEVIVTAQKRSENILSVPISITAVSEAV